MDDDECPDSTVMMDDDDMDDEVIDVSYQQHRRSIDEPQSNRISSSGMQFPVNFTIPQQLPPLPKLIFRPPTHAGNYPSVSFASTQQHQSVASRIASTINSAASRSDNNLAAPRLSAYPSSRSESFPGTRVNQSQREIPLPRLEPMSRSELTISRVSSTPSRLSAGRIGVSSSTQNEFARVGGVSISRVVENPPNLSRMGSALASAKPRTNAIQIPPLKRIGQGASASQQQQQQQRHHQQQQQQGDTGDSSRKFGRRFLKAKPPLQSATSRMPMAVMRASSTDEYYSAPVIQGQDSLVVDSDAAVDYVGHKRQTTYPLQSASASTPSTSKKSMMVSETVSSLPGIKLHINKKPVEVIDVQDESSSERSSNSLSSSLINPDSNIKLSFDFLPPSISPTHTEEMSIKPVKPVTLKVSKLKPRVNIPRVMIDEANVDDNDNAKDDILVSDEDSRASSSRFQDEDSIGQSMETDDSSRRSKRKRQPVHSPQSPPKIRKRRGGATLVGLGVMAPAVAEVLGTTPTRGRGRPAGSGRGRGRPRGSTNKAKLEREMAQKLSQEKGTEQDEEGSEPTSTPTKEENEDQEKESPTVGSSDTQETESPSALPLGGDPEVNAEVSSASSPLPKRGRGSRGPRTPRGTPKTPRASRGARTPKSPKAEKKSPEEKKKAKQEKKEAIKAPPPVQVFEEETRMSADIKPPVQEKVIAIVSSVLVDEESRASNVSSTSTSTTAKAKRFTKDPIEERKPVTAETLFEYQWPPTDKNAEFYFLQEQISEYLGVKSFKRKYPDIRRRVVDMEERDFLRDSKVVSETMCDLGLTAVHSCDVLDIMFNDFSGKYEEYRKVFQQKKEQEMANLKPTNGVVGAETPAVRDRSGEFMRRILKSCATWNFNNNRERLEERVCSFDLQTGTLHYPKDKLKVLPPEATKIGSFPVAVLPGQFTDSYKKYTPDELSYLPLNTVRFGPVNENWVVDSESSDESSDSDSDSSSNDSSSSSSDDEDGSIGDNDQNYITLTDDVGNVLYRGLPGLTKVSTDAKCKSCDGTSLKNKDGHPEVLLHCSRCDVANHPTCLELTVDMLPFITKYHWECTDCKNCIECNDPADEDKMLFCDCCDRGYHIYCVGLRKVPTGRWHCSVCAVCYSCGVTQPSQDDRMAEWHHEFRKGEKGTKFYLHSLCVACHKLYKKGQFCPSCLKVHTKLADNKDLLECRKCEKWVHRGCVKRPLKSMFGFMCDPCDANFRSRSKLPSHVN